MKNDDLGFIRKSTKNSPPRKKTGAPENNGPLFFYFRKSSNKLFINYAANITIRKKLGDIE